MKLDCRITGVHSRDKYINELLKQLNLNKNCVYYDDLTPPGHEPVKHVCTNWLYPIEQDVTHRIVLTDDVQLCDNFYNYVYKIIENFPNAVIGLFPNDDLEIYPQYAKQIQQYISSKSSPYWKVSFVSGQAIVMPQEYIQPCFNYILENHNENTPDDNAISDWCNSNDITMITTIPALIQHIGDVSVIDARRPIRRTKYFQEDVSNANWDDTTLNKIIMREVIKIH